MEPENLLRRVHELELEVQKLKAQVAKSGGRRVQVVVKKSVGFVLTYWTLLSFVVALGVALYIKYAFNVDYFENYRSMAASRETSAFHNKLGNDLLHRQEWSAAEEAFTRALAANANNADASYGLLKSRIFKPAAGEKLSSPRSQDTMIAFLREQRPGDADLDMLQAFRYWEQDQKAEARKFALAALEKQPDFSNVLAMLGHMSLAEGDIEAAKSWTLKASAADPGNANALSNLGFMEVLTGDFDGALDKLKRASLAEASLVTTLGISDAHRMKGEFSEALTASSAAARMAVNEVVRESRIMGNEWFYNHLPESKDDKESWKNGIYATNFDRKESLCQFAFALDLALTGDLAAAGKPWARAMELTPGDDLRDYFVNKIKATLAWSPVKVPDETKQWLQDKFNVPQPQPK